MPNTTRRTSGKKITVKVKPTKAKKKRGSKTVTAALNTYKSVKHKIGLDANGKARRVQRRADRKADKVEDIPVRKRMQVISDDTPIIRKTGVGAMENELNYTINPITRKIDYDSATNSELLNQEKLADDLEIYADKKPKKNNTLLYILLLLVAAFAVYKMTTKK